MSKRQNYLKFFHLTQFLLITKKSINLIVQQFYLYFLVPVKVENNGSVLHWWIAVLELKKEKIQLNYRHSTRFQLMHCEKLMKEAKRKFALDF